MEQSSPYFYRAEPVLGRDYDVGWIGFSDEDSLIAAGIHHAQRYRRSKDFRVNHVFIVAGENWCVEAAFGKGVVESDMREMYYEKEHRAVVFRKPRGLTPDMANRIVGTARAQLGTEFDYHVVANHVLNNNFLGYLLNVCFSGQLQQLLDHVLNRDDQWICSELAAYCLQQQPELAGRGVLDRSPGTLTPQNLFDDDELFEPLPESDDG